MTTLPAERPQVRRRLRVSGAVQGVGFRPHVFRLATELGLGGWVRNDSRGVVVEVEGEAAAVERLAARLAAEAPPLARVEAVESEPLEARGERDFRILGSARGSEPRAPVLPDAATCDACLAEVLDPADRRHRYPFTNCTDCGPRFSIVTGIPYDRPLTTMAGFEMCEACRAEYEDPRDRRFHAQPNACPACGPRLRLTDAGGEDLAARWPAGPSGDALAATAAALRAGAIVAVKGIGGYHLACRAGDEAAVAELRRRKRRDERPFALIAADLEAAAELIELGDAERRLLAGRARPIVIAPRRPDAAVAPSVAPGLRELGVMLPYTPLHHLLVREAGTALVMTSGNVSEEPIAYTDDEALARLGGIADAFCTHDRPIHSRTDDSVVRALPAAVRERPLLLRRSRGYVPEEIALPFELPRPLLGCGAELKSTFCLASGRSAWVGPHVGDLRNLETLRSFEAGIELFERLYALRPELLAHDLHPDYLATRYALARDGVEQVAVGHHHAHLAACLAEHGETAAAVGAIFDGAGLGPDGTVWGGEILAGDLRSCERAGALLAVPLPGGDAAAREPWRMAAAWLGAALGGEPPLPRALRGEVAERDWTAVGAIAAAGINSPPTTSAGRLFDAVAALCGIRARSRHEGQAAAELEAAADPGERRAYPLELIHGEAGVVLDARATVAALAADLERGVGTGAVAARFHNGLAAAAAEACARVAVERGLGTVVLAGGVWQNRLLVERTVAGLRERGLRVLLGERLPPNDGAISFGQVAVAGARDAAARGMI